MIRYALIHVSNQETLCLLPLCAVMTNYFVSILYYFVSSALWWRCSTVSAAWSPFSRKHWHINSTAYHQHWIEPSYRPYKSVHVHVPAWLIKNEECFWYANSFTCKVIHEWIENKLLYIIELYFSVVNSICRLFIGTINVNLLLQEAQFYKMP